MSDEHEPNVSERGPPPRGLGAALWDAPEIWSQRIVEFARLETSALSKSRGMLAAAFVSRAMNEADTALQFFREATQAVPKLAVPALLYRGLAGASELPEFLIQNLEQVARKNESLGARAQATLEASNQYRRRGDLEHAQTILDKSARADGDPEVELTRAVVALSQDRSISGFSIPEPFIDALSIVVELLDGKKASQGEDTDARSSVLALVRALRAVREGDSEALDSALETLGKRMSGGDEAAFLARTLLTAVDPTGQDRAKALLADRLRNGQKSRFVVRLLARLASQTLDRPLVALSLAEAEPAMTTFSEAEYAFLAHQAGSRLALAPDTLERADLTDVYRRALTRFGSEPIATTAGAEAAAGLELGQPDLFDQTPGLDTWSHSDPEGPAEIFLTLRALYRALETKNTPALAQLFLTFPSHLNDDRVRALGARLIELGDRDRAIELFEELTQSSNATTRVYGLLALRRLRPESQDILVQLVDAARAFEPKVRAALTLKAAWDLEGSASAAAFWELSSVWSTTSGARRAALIVAQIEEELAEKAGTLEHPARAEALLTATDGAPEAFRDFALTWAALSTKDRETQRALLQDVRENTADPLLVDSLLQALGHLRAPLPLNTERPWSVAEHWLYRSTAGDLNGALDLLLSVHLPESSLLESLQMQEELRSGRGARASLELIEQAKANDPVTRERAIRELIDFDMARGDTAAAQVWRRLLVEEGTTDVRVLLELEENALDDSGHANPWALLPVLGKRLPPSDRDAYLLIDGSLRFAAADFRASAESWRQLRTPWPLLAVRGLITDALDRNDFSSRMTLNDLLEPGVTPSGNLDAIALWSRVAFDALERSDINALDQVLTELRSRSPDSYFTLLLDYERTRLASEPNGALTEATRLLALAKAAGDIERRLFFQLAAARAYITGGDLTQARAAYETVFRTNPTNEEAFEALENLCAGDDATLAELLLERLRADTSIEQRVLFSLRVAPLLATLGQLDRAIRVVSEALEVAPDTTALLEFYAKNTPLLGLYAEAERAYRRLLELVGEGAHRIELMTQFAALSAHQLDKLEQAMDLYQGLIERRPSDLKLLTALVDVFARLGFVERATSLQTQIIQLSETPEQKMSGAIGLANLYRTLARDLDRAQMTLERAGRAFPLDAGVLRARAEIYDETGNPGARRLLLDRAQKDARRKLESAHLDRALFETLAATAELLGQPEQSQGARLALDALIGEWSSTPRTEVGLLALRAELDEFLTPPGLPRQLRRLLDKTGNVLDAAFSLDLSSLQTRPAEPSVATLIAEQARLAFGVTPEVFEAASIGGRLIPVSRTPLRFLVGPEFTNWPASTQMFLLRRAFKVQLLGIGAFVRGRAEDNWPMLVALLSLFAPSYKPTNTDLTKVQKARALIEQGLARIGYDDEVPTLALETLGALGGKTQDLGAVGRVAANRAALLSNLDFFGAFAALSPHDRPIPPTGPTRLRWLETHPEARDLLLFAASEPFATAQKWLQSVSAPGIGPKLAP